MIDINEINKTIEFEKIKDSKTQVDYYIENNSHPDILKIVALGNKSFGERLQRIVVEYLKIDNPDKTGHDGKLNEFNVKFEIKSSRFWVSNGDWKWQHIMEEHNYDYLLFVGVNFNSIDVFILPKSDITMLKEKKIITQQGGAEGQGLWVNFSMIKEYLTPISNHDELIKYLNNS